MAEILTRPLREGANVFPGVVIHSRGLRGAVTVDPPGTPHPPLLASLAAQPQVGGAGDGIERLLSDHFTVQQQIVVDGEFAGSRQLLAEKPMIAVEPTAPGPGEQQVLLIRDPLSGTFSWHYPEPAPPGPGVAAPNAAPGQNAMAAANPASARNIFKIPIETVAPATAGVPIQARGLLGGLVTRVIRVLTFKLLKKPVGEAAEFFAARWEKAHVPYRVRKLTGDDLRQDWQDIEPAQWPQPGGPPSLLFVHGTFSTVAAFNGLDQATVRALRASYPDRIFAFDHPTVSVTPTQNVDWLANWSAAPGRPLFDLVSHSRGGLVARRLAGERPAGAGESPIEVRRTVLVASPNAGTALADPDHLSRLLDVYTNMLAAVLPGNPISDGLAAVLEAVKDVAANAAAGLTGLASMRPGGPYIEALNAAPAVPSVDYFAIGSDYEPPINPADVAVDVVADLAFSGAGNDLVVPAHGAFEADGAAHFPVPAERLLMFAGPDHVNHNGYFVQPRVREKLAAWLA